MTTEPTGARARREHGMNATATPQAATVELAAGPIDYLDTGGDGPCLVLIHGALMNHTAWSKVITELAMHLTAHDPSTVPPTEGAYVNALEVSASTRWLFISGQIPQTATGNIPDEAEAQCRQIWRNIQQCLQSAALGVTDLVHVRTYLSDRSLAAVNTAVRNEVLSGHRPALTVVVAEIFDERWLLESEAVAAAP